MLAARASAITARAGAGSARKPNAGTSATTGETRAQARPSRARSTPERAKASARVSAGEGTAASLHGKKAVDALRPAGLSRYSARPMAFDLDLAGKPGPPITRAVTWTDVVLYALGVGAKREELDYLYEGRGPKVLPSFAVVPKFGPMLDLLARSGGNLATVVYGGERVQIHAPLVASGVITTTATIRAFYDMKRMAQVLVDARSVDAAGALVAESTSAILFRGEGGFGGAPPPREDASAIERPRELPPTFSREEPTTPEQALLYRLSGDHNPLHADP